MRWRFRFIAFGDFQFNVPFYRGESMCWSFRRLVTSHRATETCSEIAEWVFKWQRKFRRFRVIKILFFWQKNLPFSIIFSFLYKNLTYLLSNLIVNNNNNFKCIIIQFLFNYHTHYKMTNINMWFVNLNVIKLFVRKFMLY